MKPLRHWLLLLLVALLPLRGAMAGALLCPVGGSGLHGPASVQMPAPAAMQGDAGDAGDAGAHGAETCHDTKAPGTPGACQLCASFCSLTPLWSDMPRLPEPGPLPGVKFPDIAAPAPHFLSDGQERPPRTP